MPAKKTRFVFFTIITISFVIIIIFRYFQIMIFTPSDSSRHLSQKPLVERGPILDRNGRILAIQTRLNSVTAWIPTIANKEKTAKELASILDVDGKKLLVTLNSHTGFVYIKRKITPTQSKDIKERIDRGVLPGISLEPEYGRNYPEKELTGHLTGFTGTDNIGLDGLELSYNDILSPKNPAINGIIYGNQLFLTIDLTLQYFTEKLAREAFRKYRADGVMILMMDAKNGDILSYASIPEFDPNNFTTATKKEKENRPVTFAYEPGSVFKIFSLSSMMEIGGITQNSHFFCNGEYKRKFPDETVVIHCLGVHGDVTPQKIIEYSCNAGAAYASDTVSILDFYLKLKDFGFGSRTGIPFPGETTGLLKKPEFWSGRTKPTIAIGQEISVSAIQMITAATVLANKGILLQPHIIKKIVSPEGKLIKEFERTPVRNVVSPSTAESILLDMETATLPRGTARRLRIKGLRISAKTGTAQKIDPKTKKYSKNAFVSSTMAIFPTNNPQVIIYAVIDTPRGKEYYGGRIVAPMVKKLIEKAVPLLGIKKSTDITIVHSKDVKINLPKKLIVGNTMPDLKGLSKRQLLPLFSLKGVSVTIHGEGWVSSQRPAPGTKISKGMRIDLILQ